MKDWERARINIIYRHEFCVHFREFIYPLQLLRALVTALSERPKTGLQDTQRPKHMESKWFKTPPLLACCCWQSRKTSAELIPEFELKHVTTGSRDFCPMCLKPLLAVGLGIGEGQGSLACCSPRGRKESDPTEWANIKLLLVQQLFHKRKLSSELENALCSQLRKFIT